MSRNFLPRIAFVSHSPWFAGAERALINLLEHLPEQEIQPIVIFPDTDGPVKKIVKERLGLPVFELPYGFSLPAIGRCGFEARLEQESAAFASIYRELEVDAVVVNTTVIFPAAAAAMSAGVPLLVHSHGVIFPRLFPGLDLPAWNKLESLQLNVADRILVPSAWVSAQCRRACRLSQADITVLPNGTKLPELHDNAGVVVQERVPEFVMLCTLEPNKGVSTFLEAAAIILAKRPASATFTVYGDGAPEYRESLFAFIKQHNLGSSCFLHPKQANVDSIYRRCCAAIVASEIESFSLVAIEAMSYAKPVIATRCGGPEDIVEEEKTGYLIPIGDSELLAERMIRLLDDPGLGCEMGLAGRERVKSYYDINKVARDYLDNILDMIERPRNPESMERKRLLMALTILETPSSHHSDDLGDRIVSDIVSESSINMRTNVADSNRESILLNALLRIKEYARVAD